MPGPAALLLLLLLAAPALAQERFVVAPQPVEDLRPVIATVESLRQVEARTRLAGTLTSLAVREGDAVAAGQLIAEVNDPKLALQRAALDARLVAFDAQRRQAGHELERTRALRASGAGTQVRLEDAQTALDVVEAQSAAARAEREVVVEQQREGRVLAPQAGRILSVSGTVGAVVRSGEALAVLATERFVLRLRLPERHARFLRPGDAITVGARGLGERPEAALGRGTIRLVYPQLQEGQVVADADVGGLGDFFVGERVAVTILADQRSAIVIPLAYLITGPGLDLVRLEGGAVVPVQRGPTRSLDGVASVEILSGLRAGDVLVRP